MTTIHWMTGFEHGLGTLSTSGGGLANAIVASPTIQSTIKRTGDYAIEFDPFGAAESFGKTISGDTVVFSVYVYFTSLPGTGVNIVTGISGSAFSIYFNSSDNKLYPRIGAVNGTAATSACTTGVWYRIDGKFYSGASATIDWELDGVSQTQHTQTISATTFTSLIFGFYSTITATMYMDDIIISLTSADFPIGEHAIIGLRPNADGTHNAGTNIMEDSAGNDINGSTVFAYDKLDENPWTSSVSDYIRQAAAGTGNYVEVTFPDTTETNFIGVYGFMSYAAAATQNNNGACYILSNTTESAIYGLPSALANYSDTTAFYKSAVISPDGGTWDQSKVNALKCRCGNSSDATPIPYWLAVILEVAYAPEISVAGYMTTNRGYWG